MGKNRFSHSGEEKPLYHASSPLPSASNSEPEEAGIPWQILPPIITSRRIPIVGKNSFPVTEPLYMEAGPAWQFLPPIITTRPLPVIGQDTFPIASSPQEAPIQRDVSFSSATVNENKALFDPYSFESPQAWEQTHSHEEQKPTNRERKQKRQSKGYGRVPGWQPGVKPGLPPAGYISHWDKWESHSTLPPFTQHPFWQKVLRLALQPPPEKGLSKNALSHIIHLCFVSLVSGFVVTSVPLFSIALLTQHPFTAFLIGMASALGVGLARTFIDFATMSRKDRPALHSGAVGLLTFLGGMIQALPFLLPDIQIALCIAAVIGIFALVALVTTYSALFSFA